MTPTGRMGYLSYQSNRIQQGDIDYNESLKTLNGIKAITIDEKNVGDRKTWERGQITLCVQGVQCASMRVCLHKRLKNDKKEK